MTEPCYAGYWFAVDGWFRGSEWRRARLHTDSEDSSIARGLLRVGTELLDGRGQHASAPTRPDTCSGRRRDRRQDRPAEAYKVRPTGTVTL